LVIAEQSCLFSTLKFLFELTEKFNQAKEDTMDIEHYTGEIFGE